MPEKYILYENDQISYNNLTKNELLKILETCIKNPYINNIKVKLIK